MCPNRFEYGRFQSMERMGDKMQTDNQPITTAECMLQIGCHCWLESYATKIDEKENFEKKQIKLFLSSSTKTQFSTEIECK